MSTWRGSACEPTPWSWGSGRRIFPHYRSVQVGTRDVWCRLGAAMLKAVRKTGTAWNPVVAVYQTTTLISKPSTTIFTFPREPWFGKAAWCGWTTRVRLLKRLPRQNLHNTFYFPREPCFGKAACCGWTTRVRLLKRLPLPSDQSSREMSKTSLEQGEPARRR